MKQLIANKSQMRSHHGGIIETKKQKRIKIRDSFEILQRSNRCIRKIIRNQFRLDLNKVHVVEYEHRLGKVAMLRKYLM
jgi:hypothetical protein